MRNAVQRREVEAYRVWSAKTAAGEDVSVPSAIAVRWARRFLCSVNLSDELQENAGTAEAVRATQTRR
jgi:hypothetical protein